MQKKLFIFLTAFLSLFIFIGCNEVITDALTTTEETTSIQTSTEASDQYKKLEITRQDKVFYEIDESFSSDSLELTATLSNDETLIIDNNLVSFRGFNTSSPGKKTVSIIFEGILIEMEYIVLEDFAFEIEMDYYYDAINLKGGPLKAALNTIISEGFIDLLYGQAIGILEESDVDPDNPNNVIIIYPDSQGNISVPTGAKAGGGYYWNREHVWPQSRLGANVSYDNDFPSKATDVHNLRPCDPDANAYRSNDYFDYFKTNDTYNPREDVRGDIARILFYMTTKYYDLTLDDDVTTASRLKTMGRLSTLLEWHIEDPVDDFERNRNDVIYSYQGNRNPFIDYPEFVELIWGDLAE